MLRSLAILTGCLIVAATTHVAIMAAGGYGSQLAPLQIAVALGLCVGSACIGLAWGERRWALSWAMVAALLAGEGYALLTTAERTIAARDGAMAPIRAAEAALAKATGRVEAAEAAKRRADDAAITEAAKPGCRRECRILLEGAKADAQRERANSRAALAGLAPVRSASPLADRLGIASWALDLIAAALASIAANGLGAALIALGAHRPAREDEHAATTLAPTTQLAHQPAALPAPTPRDHAARFGLDVLAPGDTSVPIVKLHAAYLDWCRSRHVAPFAPREIAAALSALFEKSGLEIVEVEGQPHVTGARLKVAA